MFELQQFTLLVATVGAGLVAGLCYTFASFLMSALDRLGAPDAIRAMQAINARILRSGAMLVWFGTALVGALAAALAEHTAVAVTAAALYVVGAIVVTGRGNVPLNEQLDRVDPDGPDAEQAWRRYRRLWGRWNTLRTAACVLATGGFAAAL